MAQITSHGKDYKDPFEGWYGKCNCGTEFRLSEGDKPFFTGVSIKPLEDELEDKLKRGDLIVRPHRSPAELLLEATFPCPEQSCRLYAAVSPFAFSS